MPPGAMRIDNNATAYAEVQVEASITANSMNVASAELVFHRHDDDDDACASSTLNRAVLLVQLAQEGSTVQADLTMPAGYQDTQQVCGGAGICC